MRQWIRIATLGVLILLASAGPAQAGELVLTPASNYIIEAKINGHPVRLKVSFDAYGWVMINRAVATRVGLNGSIIKFDMKIGKDKIHVDSSLTKLEVPGLSKGRRIFWFDRDIESDADGIISPMTLADDIVTLQFRPTASMERTIELPAKADAFRGIFHSKLVGDRDLFVQFSTYNARNMATAAAGAQLAELFDGHWAGAPEPVPIRLDIKRPGRQMALRRPLSLASLSVSSFLVRTADYRGNFQLPPEEQADADPDEIVVTGKTSKGRARLWLTLARETLDGCSSISHDKIRQMIVLRCP